MLAEASRVKQHPASEVEQSHAGLNGAYSACIGPVRAALLLDAGTAGPQRNAYGAAVAPLCMLLDNMCAPIIHSHAFWATDMLFDVALYSSIPNVHMQVTS